MDEIERTWIAERAYILAQSINKTTREAILAEIKLGMEAGESVGKITKRISGYFDTKAKVRATQVARTEVIAASNEGALRRYQKEGILKSEFYPSPDACPECVDLIGVYPTTESHGMIPVHPSCRCVWLSVVEARP